MEQQIREKLLRCGQPQLAAYIEGLEPAHRQKLEAQIAQLDLSFLQQDSMEEARGAFSPLSATRLDEIAQNRAEFERIGAEAIREGKVGAVLLAGGQGSRLGFEHPKGMFNIGVKRQLFIFECLIRNLREVVDQCGAWVPLFIMTSADNHEETEAFFIEQKFFGYNRDYVWFFEQEQLPVIDTEGRLLLSEQGKVLTAPNGNGGWYASMAHTGMLDIIRDKQITWMNVFAVDNVLQRIADPCFIGAVIASGKVSGAKVVAKAAPDEKVGVLCLEDGKPSIVEYFEMTEEMRTRREPDGTLSYNYGVILNYLFRVDQLDRTLTVQLPLHRAFKKIRHMTPAGEIITPEQPNAYKFETLALDMVKLQENCLAFEVDRSREFAPVKNKTGVDSVDSARALLTQNGIEL